MRVNQNLSCVTAEEKKFNLLIESGFIYGYGLVLRAGGGGGGGGGGVSSADFEGCDSLSRSCEVNGTLFNATLPLCVTALDNHV